MYFGPGLDLMCGQEKTRAKRILVKKEEDYDRKMQEVVELRKMAEEERAALEQRCEDLATESSAKDALVLVR